MRSYLRTIAVLGTALCSLAACSSSAEVSSSTGTAPGKEPARASEKKSVESKSSLETAFTNIDLALNATYDFPKPFSEASTFGSTLRPSLQGFWYFYYGNSDIRVEHSLTGKKDLKTLAVDLQKETKDPSLEWYYSILSEDKEPPLEIAKTEDVTVGDYETVYFESKLQHGEFVVGGKYSKIYLGYNFMFGDKAVSVSTSWIDPSSLEDKEKKDKVPSKENLQEALRHIVLSMKPYDGKSTFADFKYSLREVLDDGSFLTSNKWGPKSLTINMPSKHVINMGLGNELSSFYGFFVVKPEEMDYKGDPATIMDLLFKPKLVTNYSGEKVPAQPGQLPFLDWEKNKAGKWEINDKFTRKDLGKVKVNDYEFNTYLLERRFNQEAVAGDSYYMATADIDGVPVVYAYQPMIGSWGERLRNNGVKRSPEQIADTLKRLGKTWLLTVKMHNSEEEAISHVHTF